VNGKICKRLRQVAAQLPPIDIKKIERLAKLGHELTDIEKALLKEQRIPFAENKLYHASIVVDGQINHFNALKKIYVQGGETAVIKYADNMQRLAARIHRQTQTPKPVELPLSQMTA
jgi:hypothetical protein